MSFDKRTAMKKFVEDQKDEKVIEPTQSYGAAPSMLVKKRWQQQTSFRLQRFEETNRENQLAAIKYK